MDIETVLGTLWSKKMLLGPLKGSDVETTKAFLKTTAFFQNKDLFKGQIIRLQKFCYVGCSRYI